MAPHVKRLVGVESFNKTLSTVDSRVMNCRRLDECTSLCTASFDKVFSNAALHLVIRGETTRAGAIKSCFNSPNLGDLVNKSSALGSIAELHAAIIGALIHQGFRMFSAEFLALLPNDDQREAVAKEVGRHQHGGMFTVSYIRVRFVARKDQPRSDLDYGLGFVM
ncbi:hypothetical protein F4804DRAFT_347845 [Jackrogersella minutella]|nr:hypothetical protein F4804DRAFT_347845 [Jackrogersella minutella]